jgi:hypothetical protein
MGKLVCRIHQLVVQEAEVMEEALQLLQGWQVVPVVPVAAAAAEVAREVRAREEQVVQADLDS